MFVVVAAVGSALDLFAGPAGFGYVCNIVESAAASADVDFLASVVAVAVASVPLVHLFPCLLYCFPAYCSRFHRLVWGWGRGSNSRCRCSCRCG